MKAYKYQFDVVFSPPSPLTALLADSFFFLNFFFLYDSSTDICTIMFLLLPFCSCGTILLMSALN